MKILIIEDEKPAARQLEKMLANINPAYKILEILDSVESSVHWLQNNPKPDLIFMDIQIADGLSFDIFTQVEVTAPVIFTTAFDQYAVKAFRVAAIDYLLKPIDPDELVAALDRYEEHNQSKNIDIVKMLDFFQKKTIKERFLVKKGQNFVSIGISEIAYFHSDTGITQANMLNGHRYIIEHTLDELEQIIDEKCFFRINRKMIVQNIAIQKISPHFNSRLKIEINPTFQEDIFVARERVANFKTWLGG